MKKMSKILLTFVFIFIMIGNANAADSFTLNFTDTRIPKEEGYHNDYPNWYIFYKVNTNPTEYVFCMDRTKSALMNGVYTYKEELTNSSSICGIFKGLKDKSLTDEDIDDAWQGDVTKAIKIQKKIWDSRNTENCEKMEIKVPIKNDKEETAKAEINIAPKSIKMTMKGNYYVSNPITVDYDFSIDEGYIVSLEDSGFLPTDAIVVTKEDSDTDVKGSTIKEDKLYIKVPVNSKITQAMNFKLKVNATFTTNTKHTYIIKEYTAGAEHQNIGDIERKKLAPVVEQAEDSVSVYSESANFVIEKINKISKKPVKGAVFSLVDLKGNPAKKIDGSDVKNLVTDKEGKIVVNNILPGTYKLKETKPAVGYLTQTEEAQIEIIVKNSTTVTIKSKNLQNYKIKDKNIIQITNNPVKQKFSKKSATNQKELEGAHIIIKDEKGKVVQDFVSKKEPTEFYLEPGKYVMIEESAPKGYQKLEVEFKFEVLETGEVKLLSAKNNAFIPSGNIITLYDYPMTVPVPDTKKQSIIYVIIGSIIVLAGGGIVYLNAKEKKKGTKKAVKKSSK